jgi:hypothetical protein
VSTVVGGRSHTRLVRSCESSQRAARARIALDEIGQRSGDRTLVGLHIWAELLTEVRTGRDR